MATSAALEMTASAGQDSIDTPLHKALLLPFDRFQDELAKYSTHGGEEHSEEMLQFYHSVANGKLKDVRGALHPDDDNQPILEYVLHPVGTLLDVALHFARDRVASYLLACGSPVILDKPNVQTKYIIYHVIHGFSLDKLHFVCELQEHFWKRIGKDIDDVKEMSIDEYQQHQHEAAATQSHRRRLERWHEAISFVDFQELLKVPSFIHCELDAAAILCAPLEAAERQNKVMRDGGNLDKDYDLVRMKEYFHRLRIKPNSRGNMFYDYSLLHAPIKKRILKNTVSPSDRRILKAQNKMAPIQMIADCNNHILLDHPVVQKYIRSGWKFALIFYIPYLLFFLAFIMTFSFFMALETLHVPQNGTTSLYDNPACVPNPRFYGLGGALIALSFIGIVLEIVQIVKGTKRYFALTWVDLIHNILDWYTFITCFVVVVYSFSYGCMPYGSPIWQTGVITLIVASMHMISCARIIPHIGIYISMLEMIFVSFVQFFAVLLLYLLSFAVTFQVVFPYRNHFKHYGYSFLSMWVMMVGEINYTDLIEEENDESIVPDAFKFSIFVMFLIVLSLMIMNLLTGLAVTDIQGLLRESTYSILRMQVQYIHQARRMATVYRSPKYNPRDDPDDDNEDGSMDQIEYPLYYDGDSGGGCCSWCLQWLSTVPWVDSLLYGPVTLKGVNRKIDEIIDSKKTHWYIVPNIEWRKTTNDVVKDISRGVQGNVHVSHIYPDTGEKHQEIVTKLSDIQSVVDNSRILIKLDGGFESVTERLKDIRENMKMVTIQKNTEIHKLPSESPRTYTQMISADITNKDVRAYVETVSKSTEVKISNLTGQVGDLDAKIGSINAKMDHLLKVFTSGMQTFDTRTKRLEEMLLKVNSVDSVEARLKQVLAAIDQVHNRIELLEGQTSKRHDYYQSLVKSFERKANDIELIKESIDVLFSKIDEEAKYRKDFVKGIKKVEHATSSLESQMHRIYENISYIYQALNDLDNKSVILTDEITHLKNDLNGYFEQAIEMLFNVDKNVEFAKEELSMIASMKAMLVQILKKFKKNGFGGSEGQSYARSPYLKAGPFSTVHSTFPKDLIEPRGDVKHVIVWRPELRSILDGRPMSVK